MNAEIAAKLPEIVELCERHRVARLELFGSATESDFDRELSDFDFLVEFLEYGPNTRFAPRFFEFEADLKATFQRSLDLGSARSPIRDPEMRANIDRQRITVYEAPAFASAS